MRLIGSRWVVFSSLIILCLSGCGGGEAPLISKEDLAAREARLEPEVTAASREQERLRRVGGELLAAMSNPPRVEFVLVDDGVVNLGGTPRTVVATSGLVALVESDDELAGLLGHELVHVAQRHIETYADVGLLMRILAGLVEVASPEGKEGIIEVGDAFGVEFELEQEIEADSTGLLYAYRAGYDPMAGYKVWERLATEVPQIVSRPIFTIHPITTDRLIRMRSVAEALLAGGG